ncbi:MAG: hypothetical protein ACLS95_07785 [Clostridia bacterium]
MKFKKPIIVFDFDGVIHSYTSGWKGHAVIPDPPVKGIKEVIDKVRKDYKVVVVSSRCNETTGVLAIKAYLKKHDIKVDYVTNGKPPAVMYIDDRGICFDGNAEHLLHQIENFEPWQNKVGDKDD